MQGYVERNGRLARFCLAVRGLPAPYGTLNLNRVPIVRDVTPLQTSNFGSSQTREETQGHRDLSLGMVCQSFQDSEHFRGRIVRRFLARLWFNAEARVAYRV